MKATVVPAQITNVEDRVAGNLGFSQLILFAVPVFGGALLYAILPPFMEYCLYKIIVIGVITVFSSILAIRIKGKIILLWLVVLLSYNFRPKLFLFNKCVVCYRKDYPETAKEFTLGDKKIQLACPVTIPKLGSREMTQLYVAMENPVNRLCFETNRKGKMNVRITEIQK